MGLAYRPRIRAHRHEEKLIAPSKKSHRLQAIMSRVTKVALNINKKHVQQMIRGCLGQLY